MNNPAPDVKTLADLPFHLLGRFQKPMLLGRCREGGIDGLSNKEVFDRVRDLSLGFKALGLEAGDRVAIVAESRPEWVLCDLAILAAGGVTVPIYPTLSAAQARYILQDSGAKIVVVSTRQQLEKIQEVRHLLPALEVAVTMDAKVIATASITSLDEVERRGHERMTGEWGTGRAFRDDATRVTPGQLATIIYTSGTTGEPKGVRLSHQNLVSNMIAGASVLDVGQEDAALSFLPLSHSFERMVAFVYLFTGVSMVFAETMETIARDIGIVRPTVLTGVPRVYEKLQARILEKGRAGSPFKARLFQWAIGVGQKRAADELRGRTPGALTSLQSRMADKLVFSKIRAGIGGRLRFAVSGSAPLAPAVHEFFHGVGVPIVEGYGLTESAPILTVNPQRAPRVGTVGRAIPGVELRIAADGEILARGPNIMSGYFNKEQASGEVLRDGWLHTGDIGTLDAEGYLTITDRKKDLIVTAGGKNIAPQPIEGVLKSHRLIAEAIVLGDRRRFVAALIVPDFTILERRLKDLGRPPGERDALVTRPDVVALYQEIVDGLNHDLAQYERIKRIALLPAEFSIESGELTPTLKVKRKVIEERWREQIEELYDEP
ncbi:MAG: long-chain fatty acid--CoA ligase [Acidobacteria bacterium]|nr:long-chain fatty acid--CoA ligase [Acidobacteriota bacterium]